MLCAPPRPKGFEIFNLPVCFLIEDAVMGLAYFFLVSPVSHEMLHNESRLLRRTCFVPEDPVAHALLEMGGLSASVLPDLGVWEVERVILSSHISDETLSMQNVIGSLYAGPSWSGFKR